MTVRCCHFILHRKLDEYIADDLESTPSMCSYEYDSSPLDEPIHGAVCYTQNPTNRPIYWRHFNKIYTKLSADSDYLLSNEYEMLAKICEATLYANQITIGAGNGKNRYKDILPCKQYILCVNVLLVLFSPMQTNILQLSLVRLKVYPTRTISMPILSR